MPREPLPGCPQCVRVVYDRQVLHGASERMVVSPGHEADAILHLPGASPNALFPPPRGPPAHRPPGPIQQHCCKTALNFLFFILRTTGIGIICRT